MARSCLLSNGEAFVRGARDGDVYFRFPSHSRSLPHPDIRSFLALGSLANSCHHDDGRDDLSDAMGIVHSKVLGGANPHGSGRGILQVGIGAYRYVSLSLMSISQGIRLAKIQRNET